MLIGIERERSKGHGPSARTSAGLRTFTLICPGRRAQLLARRRDRPSSCFGVDHRRCWSPSVICARASDDPGLTTEIAMVVTFLLGGLAQCSEPQLAAALGGHRDDPSRVPHARLHDWVKNVLTDEEIRDGLMLAAAALVILPIDAARSPSIRGASCSCASCGCSRCSIMAINALGYIACARSARRSGLALAGLFSGFVSSTATIGAMGRARARATRSCTRARSPAPRLHRSRQSYSSRSSSAWSSTPTLSPIWFRR